MLFRSDVHRHDDRRLVRVQVVPLEAAALFETQLPVEPPRPAVRGPHPQPQQQNPPAMVQGNDVLQEEMAHTPAPVLRTEGPSPITFLESEIRNLQSAG